MDKGNGWWRQERKRLIDERGGACEGLPGEPGCGSTEDLEFAHIAPTKLNGRGRGYSKRVMDVRDHPEAYRLLCKACHWFLDFGNPPEPPFLPEPEEIAA